MHLNKRIQHTIIIVLMVSCLFALVPHSSAQSYTYDKMWPVLEQPWYFSYPAGLSFDPKGFIYISDMFNYRIRKFTSNGKFVTQWGTMGAQSGQFNSAYDIATDSQGNVFVADTKNHRIQKFSSDGQFILQWGNKGNNDGEFESPYAIVVSPDDYVYVADTSNHRIQLFSIHGIYIYQWGEKGNKTGQFNFPCGLASDNNGNVYVADTRNNRIQIISNKSSISIFDMNTIQLNQPNDIAIDNDQKLYVLDRSNKRVVKINSNGEFLQEWNRENCPSASFEDLYSIAIDPDGFVFISDFSNNCIQKFTKMGQCIERWGSNQRPGHFNYPKGISNDDDNIIYVADSGNNRIQKFSADGQFLMAWGESGTLTGQFISPRGIAVDHHKPDKKRIFVSDTGNKRIQVFSSNGQFLGLINNEKITGTPYGLDCDQNGYLYVTDKTNGKIYKINPEGIVEQEWGEKGDGIGQFNTPSDIACDDNDPNQIFVYVVDTNNNRIQKFSSNGAFINQWGKRGENSGEFYYPTAIDIDSEGYVYVTDMKWQTKHIQVFDSKGNYISQLGEGGYYPGQIYDPEGIAIGPDDHIYVSDTFHHRIQVFKKDLIPVRNQQNISHDKAIIVAGGGPYPGNDLCDATQMNANYSFQVCIYNGLTKEDIYYFSEDMDLDLDGNDRFDDVDSMPEIDTLENAIKNWASDATHLLIYMVDHGGNNQFRMSRKKILHSSMLNQWLDELQNNFPVLTTVIFDACQSGSFLDDLSPSLQNKRIIISSTNKNESAYFLSKGVVSFSYNFWTQIFFGQSIKQSFDTTISLLGHHNFQHPLMDDNGDGLYDNLDGALAETTFIGNSSVIHGDAPLIDHISVNHIPNKTSSMQITAYSVTDKDGISRVWAVIQPPEFENNLSGHPISALPEIDLMPDDDYHYEAEFSNITKSGTYKITVYASDKFGNISLPLRKTLTLSNVQSSQTLIIAGHTKEMKSIIQNNVQQALKALQFQTFSTENIKVLGPEWLYEKNHLGTLSTIESAIQEITSKDPEHVVIYIIGKSMETFFDLNYSEMLSAQQLNTWIKELQTITNALVTVVVDTAQSGYFLPVLQSDSLQNRIIITSSNINQSAYYISEGLISFSNFFWRGIYYGNTIWDAYVYARQGINFSCDIQTPQLDDNGNGIGNEKSDKLRSMHTMIGAGIKIAENTPTIGAITQLASDTKTIIKAEQVTGIDHIQKLIAVISPPCNVLSNSIKVLTQNTSNTSDYSYTFIYDNFNYSGNYQLALYAIDQNAMVSRPTMSSLTTNQMLADAYEPDNTYENAKILLLNNQNPHHASIPGYTWKQVHNFHEADDEDWMMVMVSKNEIYRITVDYQIKAPKILLFSKTEQDLIPMNLSLSTSDNTITAEFKSTYTGVCYISLSQENLLESGIADTSYQIMLTIPAGAFSGFIIGTITPVLDNIKVYTQQQTIVPFSNGTFFMPHVIGSFVLNVEAPDYYIYEKSIVVNEIEPLNINIKLLSEHGLPVIDFSPDKTTSDVTPLVVQFSDQSTGIIDEWFWDFGDGQTGTDQHALHEYQRPGIFDVSLTVKGPGGVTRSTKDDLIIIKGNDTDNDGMPDSWEKQYHLDPYKNDADDDFDDDLLSNIEEYILHTRPDNARPEMPVLNVSKQNSAIVQLTTSPFTDKNQDDVHTKTQWQISPFEDFSYVALDILSEHILCAYTISNYVLDDNTHYYARVRFMDNHNGMSEWTENVLFETPSKFKDDNQNHIPDDQEIYDQSIDLDNNQISDLDQSNMQLIQNISTNLPIAIQYDDSVMSLHSFMSILSTALTDNMNNPSNTPYGIFRAKFNITDMNEKQRYTISIHFQEKISPWASCYAYDAINGWQVLTENVSLGDHKLSLTVEDGNSIDADQIKNETIVSIFKIVVHKQYEDSKTGDNDIGSCFISTVGCLPF